MSARRLPKWKRPDREGGDAPWPGRWSLVPRATDPATHAEPVASAHAEVVARQWLDRYGVVARDWWRRERPPVPWRAIYRELRRMELRGNVRRGYFVQGLAGAQFARPDAVEQLRAAAAAVRDASGDDPIVIIAASDPANVWMLPGAGDAFARPRATGALLVMQAGSAILTSDPRARTITVRPGAPSVAVTAAVRALIRHVTARRGRDVIVETVDGAKAATSPWARAFLDAGLRLSTRGLRHYQSFERP